ncbi:MAG: hypothetical protein H7A40_04605 [Chlamydiales bacterium]|nr:hypothetical protein [Chlamydiales bacterium]
MKLYPHAWKSTILQPYFPVVLLMIFLLPMLFLFQNFSKKAAELEELKEEFALLKPKLTKALLNSNHTSEFLERYKNTNHFYLEKHLETMQFQTHKVHSIEQLLKIPEFTSAPTLIAQLNQCRHQNNSLQLKESSSRVNKDIQETELKLMQPVLIETEDLFAILSNIENKSIGDHQPEAGCPQLIFKSFDLKKTVSQDQQQIFKLDFELIKREPLSS